MTFGVWVAAELFALVSAVVLTTSNLDRRGQVVSVRWERIVVHGWAVVAVGLGVVLATTWHGWM